MRNVYYAREDNTIKMKQQSILNNYGKKECVDREGLLRNKDKLKKIFTLHSQAGKISLQEFLKFCNRSTIIPQLMTIKEVKLQYKNFINSYKLFSRYETDPILTFDLFEELFQVIALFSFKGSESERVEKLVRSIKEGVQKSYKQTLIIKDSVSDEESEIEEECPIYLLASTPRNTSMIEQTRNYSSQKATPYVSDDVVNSNIDLALKVLNSTSKNVQRKKCGNKNTRSPKAHRESKEEKKYSHSMKKNRKKNILNRSQSGTRLSLTNVKSTLIKEQARDIDEDLKEFLELESNVKSTSNNKRLKLSLTYKDCLLNYEDSSKSNTKQKERLSKSKTRYEMPPSASLIKITPVKNNILGKNSVVLTNNVSQELLEKKSVPHSLLKMDKDNDVHNEGSISFTSEHDYTRSSFKSSIQMLNIKELPKKRYNKIKESNKLEKLIRVLKEIDLSKKTMEEIIKQGAFTKWKSKVSPNLPSKSNDKKITCINNYKSTTDQSRLKKSGIYVIRFIIKGRLKNYFNDIKKHKNNFNSIKFGLLLATLMVKSQNLLQRIKKKSFNEMVLAINKGSERVENERYYTELKKMKERFSNTKDIINNWSKIINTHKID